MVLEYCSDGDLNEYLKTKNGMLSEYETIRILN